MRTDWGRWRTAWATTALAVSPGCSLAASNQTSSLWWSQRNTIFAICNSCRRTSIAIYGYYLRTHLCAFHDEVPGHLYFTSHLLQPGWCNPGRRVMRVGLPHRFQEKSSLLDVTLHANILLKQIQTTHTKAGYTAQACHQWAHLMSPPCVGIMELRSVK